MSPGTQIAHRQIGMDEMTTRRVGLVGLPFIERGRRSFRHALKLTSTSTRTAQLGATRAPPCSTFTVDTLLYC